MKTIQLILIAIIFLFLAGCGGSIGLKRMLDKSSPYEKYLSSLSEVALTATALGKDWVSAGEVSLSNATKISLPYQEILYFNPQKPRAISLSYSVQEGQIIAIQINGRQNTTKFFLDIFKEQETGFEFLAGSDTTGLIEYEVKNNETHLLRLQPELLRGGQVSLHIQIKPSLSFPVAGKNSEAVGSFFGADRDGGVRSHEGIDIFAPRGTPAIAATNGRVSRVTLNRLGGKVVFLSGANKSFSMYYAHLDSQLVSPGQRVQVGDTLGLVGNTGNAITTPPHLHFGIYKFASGAVDPYPFVQDAFLPVDSVEVDTTGFSQINTIKSAKANLREAPTTKSDIITTLPQHAVVEVLGGIGKWYRIQLPNGTLGFLYHTLIAPVSTPIDRIAVQDSAHFYTDFNSQEFQAMQFSDIDTVKVWGTFDSLQYVETKDKGFLWMNKI